MDADCCIYRNRQQHDTRVMPAIKAACTQGKHLLMGVVVIATPLYTDQSHGGESEARNLAHRAETTKYALTKRACIRQMCYDYMRTCKVHIALSISHLFFCEKDGRFALSHQQLEGLLSPLKLCVPGSSRDLECINLLARRPTTSLTGSCMRMKGKDVCNTQRIAMVIICALCICIYDCVSIRSTVAT